MKRKPFIYLFILLFFQGCEMNRSVDFILADPAKYTENGIVFSVNWKNGIPLYYFKYKAMKTSFLINLETDLNIESVVIESYQIEIPELGIDFEGTEQYKINIMDTNLNSNSIATKQYWGGKSIQIEGLISDVIRNEEELKKFKDVTFVNLNIDIVYIIEGVKKKSNLIWKFNPVIRNSNAFLDKLMSV